MFRNRRYTLPVNVDQIMAGTKGSEYIAAVGVGSRASTDGAIRSDLEPGKWLTGRSVGDASDEYGECENCQRREESANERAMIHGSASTD